MSIIETAKCKIEKLNSHAIGVGETEKGKTLIPYTLPGETVEFERHSYRGKTNFILKSIEVPSSNRIIPECEYFSRCGGCALQHINEKVYEEFKLQLIQDPLNKNNIQANINPLIIIPKGHRRRAVFEVLKKNDEVFLGFHRFHSHQIININHCPAIEKELSDLIPSLKQAFNKILQNKEKAKLHLTLANNGIDIAFELESYLDFTHKDILSKFAKEHNIARVSFYANHSSTLIYQKEKPFIKFEEFEVEIDAFGFLQSSFLSDKIMNEIILDKIKGEKIVDLFCGRGTFTLPLSKTHPIDGFDLDNFALSSLKKAASKYSLNICATSRDLFNIPLNEKELAKYDSALINPPRAGAKSQIALLSRAKINQICYISCNPQTFAEDAKLLVNSGYKLTELTPIDQFYWSAHIELIAFFERY